MPEEKNKWLDVVTRMIELTQQGRLKWTSDPSTGLARVENPRSPVFHTEYKNKLMRLYKMREEPEWDVNFDVHVLMSPQIPKWRPRIVLEFITNDGQSLWKFPEVSALDDLFSVVQYQAAGVGEFLDEILAETGS